MCKVLLLRCYYTVQITLICTCYYAVTASLGLLLLVKGKNELDYIAAKLHIQ